MGMTAFNRGRTAVAAAFLFWLCCCLDASGQARTGAARGTKAETLPATASSYETEIVASIPQYQPEQSVSGVIRVWGHGHVTLKWMQQLVTLWEEGFRKYHPGIKIQYEMHGTSSAIPALFTGVGDVAILGEEISPDAAAAFEKKMHHPPLGVEIATGSLDIRNFDYAQMFFVHKDNPLSHLTLEQLDGVFGAEHLRGPRNIRTWGDLGLRGEWKDKPVTPYGWRIDDSFGVYLEQALLNGSHRWNCALKEFAHIYRPDGSIYDHGQQILDALAKDRYGIAVSNLRYSNPKVKPLALGVQPEGPYYQASKQNLIERKYPLARFIPAFIDRAPGLPIEPRVKEFLRYILSREGQEAIIEDGRYLPLAKDDIARQLKKLE
jgi:phosphate transport system substrate-binding protein